MELNNKTGSRNSNSNVPNVNFNNGKVHVNWYNPSNSNDILRSRSEVSCHNGQFGYTPGV